MAPLRTSLATAAAAAAALLLAGCATGGPTYAALERDATTPDTMPPDVAAQVADSIDPASTRFLGEHEGTWFWLSRSTEEQGGVCLLVYPDDRSWVQGCSAGAELSVGGGGNGTFTLLPDGARVPDGHEQVAEHVSSRG